MYLSNYDLILSLGTREGGNKNIRSQAYKMPRRRKLKYLFVLVLSLSIVSVGLLFGYTDSSPLRTKFVQISQHSLHTSRDVLLDDSVKVALARLSAENIKSQTENVTKKMFLQSNRRQVLLIVAHGRSGSTFLADIFNQHPRVFYVFEPLHSLIAKQLKDSAYDEYAFKFLLRILQCDFSMGNASQHFGRFFRFKSRAMSSPPFCQYSAADIRWNPMHCLPVKQQDLEYSCNSQHDTTVFKFLLERLPSQSIETLFDVCEKAGLECKVIHLVRDIRPVMISSKKVSFFKEVNQKTKPSLRYYVYSRCEMTEKNLLLLKKLRPSVHKKYVVVRYEDLAEHPMKLYKFLYDFAGLEVLENITKWLMNTTHPSESQLKEQARNPVSVVRNSLITLNKWRIAAESCEVNIIERYCRDVMNFLGYIQTQGSDALLRNLTTPLFRDKYPVQEWNRIESAVKISLFPGT